ncbi:MAG: gamma carbonic anhydrase family protein [Candidatus Omnitrophota bacterium]
MNARETHFPQIAKTAYVDPSACVIGRVEIGEGSSIWPGAVLRGDIEGIRIGRFSNIQDLCVLHVEKDLPCRVGDYVTVGHQVTLHACRIGEGSLLGMGSIVLDGARVGANVLLGAGSLVTRGQILKTRSLYFGRPAKRVRALTRTEIRGLYAGAKAYVRLAERHARQRFARF